MNKEIFDKLLNFISVELGEPINNIDASTRLESDLKVYGDDAYDFILAYSKKFDVDLTDFNFGLYFRPEGDLLIPTILKMLGICKEKKNKELKIIDLYNGIINKKLM